MATITALKNYSTGCHFQNFVANTEAYYNMATIMAEN